MTPIEQLKKYDNMDNFMHFLEECNIGYLDEITNVIYIAYKSKYGLSKDALSALKYKVNMLINCENVILSLSNDNEITEHIILDNGFSIADTEKESIVNIIEETKKKNDVAPVSVYDGMKTIDNIFMQEYVEASIDIPLELLDLSTRTYKRLKQNGIDSLFGLFEKFSPEKITGLGEISLYEINNLKQKYVDLYADNSLWNIPTNNYLIKEILCYTRNELQLGSENYQSGANWIYFTRFKRELAQAIDVLGLEFCQYVFNNIHYVKDIFVFFKENFEEQALCVETKKLIEIELNNVCLQVKQSLLSPLIRFYKENVNLDIGSTIELLLSGFNFVQDISNYSPRTTCDANTILNFVKWLSFNLNDLGVRFINECVEHKNGSLWAIDLRAHGYTLESIALQKGLTRERIRQLEVYAINNAKVLYEKYKFIELICSIKNNMYISSKDITSFFDKSFAHILVYIFKNIENMSFHYDKDIDVFSSNVTLKDTKLKVTEEIENLDLFIFKQDWNIKIENIANMCNISYEYVEQIAKNFYKDYGLYYAKHKLSLIQMYTHILKQYYPNGIKLNDYEIETFKNLTCNTFGIKEILLSTHAIEAAIAKISVLCDRGTYLSPYYIMINKDFVERIDNYLDNMERTAITYSELFNIFKDELFLKTNINNKYFLQGIIKYFYPGKYFSFKETISKDANCRITDELNDYIKGKGVVSRKELMSVFDGVKEASMIQNLARCSEVINIDYGLYIHSSSLDIRDDDYSIKTIIEKNIQNYPLNSRKLLDILYVDNAEFLERNCISNYSKLFGIMRYMFSEEFTFSAPYIAKAGLKNVTNTSVLLSLLDGYSEFTIDELVDICEKNKIHYVSTGYVLSLIADYYIRVDKNLVSAVDNLIVEDDDIHSIKKYICTLISKSGYYSIRKINDYIWLPNLGVEWNQFLLRSILSKYDADVVLIDIPCSDTYTMDTIIVSPELNVDNYFDLIKYVVRLEHKNNPFESLKEIEGWLKGNGLIINDIPLGVFEDNWLGTDVNGMFFIR